MSQNKHVYEFSENQKLLALINSEGKLRIWDTETNALKQEYIPNLHLSIPCTCFTWVEVLNKKKKSPKKSGKTSTYLVLGTSNGGVALYSVANAGIEKQLEGNGHSAAVTSITFNGIDSIFTTSEDAQIIEWSLSECCEINRINIGKDKPSCIAIFPEIQRVITGAKQVKIWNLETNELVQTLTGHKSSITVFEKLSQEFEGTEQQYLLTSSAMDRNVLLWSLNSEGSKNAVMTFLLDEIPSFVSAKLFENRIRLIVVTRDGLAHFFATNINKKKIKSCKPTSTLEIQGLKKGSPRIPVQVAHMCVGIGVKLLIGYGNDAILKFEEIEVEEIESIVLKRDDPRIFLKETNIDQYQTKPINVVTPFVDNQNVEYLNAVNAVKKNRNKSEITMEARLENLSLNIESNNEPRAQNLAHLLVQGLQSRDASILKMVFEIEEEEKIRLTLHKLPPQYVSSLANELSSLLQKKTRHVQVAVTWLRLLIETHTSQLMALGSGNILDNFGTCLGIIEFRTEHLKSLSKLRGRLDLLVNQVQRNIKDVDKFDNDKLLVFEEKDSNDDDDDDDDDMQDDDSTDDEQWNEAYDEEMNVSD